MPPANPKHADITHADLQQLVKDGFKSSAYHGVDGVIESQRGGGTSSEEGVAAKDNLRFAAMISNNLDPYPAPKVGMVPKGLGKGTYTLTSTMNHKTHTFRNGEEMSRTLPKFDGEKSLAGRVKSGGLHNSLGFIEAQSTQQIDAERAKFDGDVMAAYEAGKKREAAAEAERSRLQSTPFQTAEPSMYVKSTQEHCNVLGLHQKNENNKPVTLHHSESRNVSPGNSSAPSPTKHDKIKAQEAALLSTLHSMREQSKPRQLRPKKSSALGWESTSHSQHDSYDPVAAEAMNDRYSTQPVSHRNQQLTDEDMARVVEVDRRFAGRFDNGFETEVSKKLQDRHEDADVVKGNGVTGTFGLKNGVSTMSGKVHHPRDVKTGHTFNVNSVVPGQFKAMSSQSLIMRDD
mgnify:CR=1 FL=1